MHAIRSARGPLRLALLLIVAALPAAGCQETEDDPAVLLTVQFEAPIDSLDQIRVSVSVIPTEPGATDVVEVVPETPADLPGPVSSPASVLVLLPDRLAGQTLLLGVVGKADDQVVGHGSVAVIPELGRVIQRDVSLTPGAPFCGNGFQEGAEQCDATAFPTGVSCETVLGLASGELRCDANCRIDASGCYECGNGAVERPLEECDGGVGEASCWTEGFQSGELRCGADCRFDRSLCVGGCGNGRVEAGEACDGENLGGLTCEDLPGAPTGELRCGADCQLDDSACHTCGDGRLEVGEACDGAALGGATCESLGLGPGILSCSAACTIDTSGCCGNGVAGPGEVCDGTDLGGQTCLTVTGKSDGALACTAECQLDASACHECGNGFREGGEACDGAAFGGASCASLGLGDGLLTCTGACTIDTSGCCGNGVAGPGEACDGADLAGQTCLTAAGLDEGTLACTPDCRLDVSGCRGCGNGVRESGEACDGAAFGGASCASLGFGAGDLRCASDCTVDTSGCCGDGVAGPGEACDAADVKGQTCLTAAGHTQGTLACTTTCQLDVSACHTCGNGAIDGPSEACDGAELGSATCASAIPGSTTGAVSCAADCTLDTSACVVCGDGVAGEGEVCDGADLRGETCLSQGYRQQAGSVLACLPGCGGYDASGCLGGAITTAAGLAGAIADAHATGAHQVIRLAEGTYTLTTSIVLDECGGACTGDRPYGVTIEPEPGAQVEIDAAGVAVAFDVVTGQNVIRDLLFSEPSTAFLLRTGADAGGNQIGGNRFENHARAPGVLIDVRSSGNAIVANLIDNQWITAAGTAAIDLSDDGNTVAMNAIYGRFTWAIDAQGLAPATLTTFIDHNSLWVTSGGGGVRLENADEVCYRNNLVFGDGTGTGLRLLNTSTAFAASTACGGYRATNNVNRGHLLACAGDAGDCTTYCVSSAASFRLCDLAVDPGWANPDLCLLPAYNDLIDAGLDLGYDLVDEDAARFVGAGPDVGAREYGAPRTFGGYVSSCP